MKTKFKNLNRNQKRFIIIGALFFLSLFFGFFRTSGCFIDESGIEICRICGTEGIFNPLLRPISFIFGNVINGLILKGELTICGMTSIILSYPFDFIYFYIFSGIIVKRKK